MDAALRIVNYLIVHHERASFFPPAEDTTVSTYCDTNYASCMLMRTWASGKCTEAREWLKSIVFIVIIQKPNSSWCSSNVAQSGDDIVKAIVCIRKLEFSVIVERQSIILRTIPYMNDLNISRWIVNLRENKEKYYRYYLSCFYCSFLMPESHRADEIDQLFGIGGDGETKDEK